MKCCLGILLAAMLMQPAFPQAQPAASPAPASDLSNRELLARSRTICVSSDTVFIKNRDMASYLLRQKELEEFHLRVVESQSDADLILRIKRIAFTNNFPFSIIDRVSNTVLIQGEINAPPSKVPGQIAAALVKELSAARTPKQEQKQ